MKCTQFLSLYIIINSGLALIATKSKIFSIKEELSKPVNTLACFDTTKEPTLVVTVVRPEIINKVVPIFQSPWTVWSVLCFALWQT